MPKRKAILDHVASVILILSLLGATAGCALIPGDMAPTLPPVTGKPNGTEAKIAGSPLLISEIMSSNKLTLHTVDQNTPDWIELHNIGTTAIDLKDYSLSDKTKKTETWKFPSVIIPAGGYLVVYASGLAPTAESDKAGEIHANFCLNAAGDNMILTAPSGQVLGRLAVPFMPPDISYGLLDSAADAASPYYYFGEPTPGQPNGQDGRLTAAEAVPRPAYGLVVNEYMTGNQTWLDPDGDLPDWVEFYNGGAVSINLLGFWLTDQANQPKKWEMPNITIHPGSYLLVWLSGKEQNYDPAQPLGLHAPFKLSSQDKELILSDPRGNQVIREPIISLPSNIACGRKNNSPDTWLYYSKATPGQANSGDGFTNLTDALQLKSRGIWINEVMANGRATTPSGDVFQADWAEIYNGSNKPIDLSGYGLSDQQDNLYRMKLTGMTIQPSQYLVVPLDGFGLSSSDETLFLTDPEQKIVDWFAAGYLPSGCSSGRGNKNGDEAADCRYFYQKPTPGQANASAPFLGMAQQPRITAVKASDGAPATNLYQDSPVLVSLSCVQAGAVIYYTLDGSQPTIDSTVYSKPILISGNQTVNCRASVPDYLDSYAVSRTYLFGKPHSLPVISLTTKPGNLWDPKTGIYMEGPNASQEPGRYKAGANYYQDTEVPASFEFYDESGQLAFHQNIALRMSGGLSLTRPQKTFAVFARAEYGAGTMCCPFFENRPFTEYKSLILRQGGRDKTKIKEVVALGLVDGKMNVLTQAIRPVILYLDGKYWGIYYLMEKRNKYMIAAHEGLTNPEQMNIIKGINTLQQGTNKGYTALLGYIKSHDMSKKESFDFLAAQLDTDSFMDYMINEIYIANNDPGNMQFYQTLPGGKWKQVYFDFCITFYSFDALSMRMSAKTAGSAVFNALLSYKPWRDQLIERFAWALKEVYAPDHVLELIDQAAGAIGSEIAADHAKFSDTATVEEWNQGVRAMQNFARKRGQDVVSSLKKAFPLSEAQIKMLDDAIR